MRKKFELKQMNNSCLCKLKSVEEEKKSKLEGWDTD